MLKRYLTYLLAPAFVLALLAMPAAAEDQDGDGLDDFVEARLCDRQVLRDTWNTHTDGAVGTCASSSDFEKADTVADAEKTVRDALDGFNVTRLLGTVLCTVESKGSGLDGWCSTDAEGKPVYNPPGVSNVSKAIEDIIGKPPVICHDSAGIVQGTASDADCDGRSNGEEIAQASSDPAGFLASPACDNPLVYEDETTDCSRLVDPEDHIPDDDDRPYPCLQGHEDPNGLVTQATNNVDCDGKSNQEEISEILADPAGFASDPTQNNPLLPE